MISPEDVTDFINKKGYYVIKNYMDKNICETIINESKSSDINFINTNNIEMGGGDLRCSNFEKYSIHALNFLNDKYILNIGSCLLNHPPDRKKKRCQLGILKYNPNKTNCSGGGWHVDNHNPQFKALLYLNNVNIDNGPFTIISPPVKSNVLPSMGDTPFLSTRFSNDIVEKKYQNNIINIIGNQGDLILVNTQFLHRGTTINNGQRYTLTNYYYD